MITIAAASLLFIYVAVITEIKNMNKDKINKIEKMNEKMNQIELANVEVQRLTAEERIVKIAHDSLGLVRPNESFEVLQISKEQINQVEKFVNEKYD
jgi:cell division protein FtsL